MRWADLYPWERLCTCRFCPQQRRTRWELLVCRLLLRKLKGAFGRDWAILRPKELGFPFGFRAWRFDAREEEVDLLRRELRPWDDTSAAHREDIVELYTVCYGEFHPRDRTIREGNNSADELAGAFGIELPLHFHDLELCGRLPPPIEARVTRGYAKFSRFAFRVRMLPVLPLGRRPLPARLLGSRSLPMLFQRSACLFHLGAQWLSTFGGPP